MFSIIFTITIVVFIKYLLIKLKKRIDLHVYSYLFFHIVYILLFFVSFVIIFRFSNLIKEKKNIDLIFVYNSLNYGLKQCIIMILLLYFLIKVRNIIFLYTKITFLKIHLYFTFVSLKNDFSYHKIFYKFCKLPEKRLFFFMLAFKKISTAKKVDNLISFLLKYLFTIILVLVFLIACNLNKFTLYFVIILLPFYGFYQMIYLSSCYLMNNLNFLKDVELIKCIYLYEFVDCNIRRSEYLKELPENLKNYLKKILS